jgi:hypothetical protein
LYIELFNITCKAWESFLILQSPAYSHLTSDGTMSLP